MQTLEERAKEWTLDGRRRGGRWDSMTQPLGKLSAGSFMGWWVGRDLPQEEGMGQVGWAKPIFLAFELKF